MAIATPTLAELLEEAREDANISREQLWLEYRENKGRASFSAFRSWLRGMTEPQVSQYNIVASVLNAHLVESGKPARLTLAWVSGESTDPQSVIRRYQHSLRDLPVRDFLGPLENAYQPVTTSIN